MLMSRRAPLHWRERLALSLWPRHSWSRSLRYLLLRGGRLTAAPHRLALGAAAGVFVAILPIPGAQMLAAAGLAWWLGGHQGAAALGTFVANPITYPLIWLGSYGVGSVLLGLPASRGPQDLDMLADFVTHSWAHALSHPASPVPAAPQQALVLSVLKTLLAGAVPLALAGALATYVSVRRLVSTRRAPDTGALLAARLRAHVAAEPGGGAAKSAGAAKAAA